jgi:uncharacterized membrane protein YGL010W
MLNQTQALKRYGHQAKAALTTMAFEAPKDLATMRVLIMLLAVALFATTQVVPANAALASNALDGLKTLAKTIIDGIIGVAALVLAVGIATNFLTGMVETTIGRPGGLSTTSMRIVGIVVCFIGAVFTIAIANALIDNLKGSISQDDISDPMAK